MRRQYVRSLRRHRRGLPAGSRRTPSSPPRPAQLKVAGPNILNNGTFSLPAKDNGAATVAAGGSVPGWAVGGIPVGDASGGIQVYPAAQGLQLPPGAQRDGQDVLFRTRERDPDRQDHRRMDLPAPVVRVGVPQLRPARVHKHQLDQDGGRHLGSQGGSGPHVQRQGQHGRRHALGAAPGSSHSHIVQDHTGVR